MGMDKSACGVSTVSRPSFNKNLVVFVSLLFIFSVISLPARAQTCPAPTLKTITIDGNPQDWESVLTNCSQTTIDGVGQGVACPSNDRDCGNINNSGRDLIRFAWTYDNNNIYIYLQRKEGTNNQMNYVFYMDSNRSVYMENNEKVLQVLTQNTSASISEYDNYVRAGAGPNDPLDKLVDANGFADGWTIQGTVSAITPASTPTAALFTNCGGNPATGCFTDNSKTSGFEVALPWADVTPVNPSYGSAPFPIDFHVSSLSGQNIPAQIQDNLGGPGGRLGSFGYSSVTVTPNNTGSSLQNNNQCFTHTVTNTGIFADTFNLAASSSNGYTVTIKTACGGSTITSTPQVASGGTYSIAVEISIPSSAPTGTIDVTTVTATSVLNPSATGSAADITGIGAVTITPPAQSKNGCLNSVNSLCTVTYTETITNNVLADNFDIRGVSATGWKVEYFDGATLMATDLNGDGTFSGGDSIVAGYDLNGDNIPDLPVAHLGTTTFTIRLTPTSGTVGTTIDVLTITASSIVNAAQASAVDVTPLLPPTELIPEYRISAGANLYGAKGFPVFFPHMLRNNTNSAAIYDLTLTNTDGFARTRWSDPNSDGDKSDGVVITQSDSLPANGGRQFIVLQVDIPGATGLTQSTTTATASPASGQPAVGTAIAQDDLKVSQLGSYVNSSFSVQGSFFTNGATVYAKGFSLTPGTVYRIRIVDPFFTVMQNQQLGANTNGDVFDSYTFAASDATGTWLIKLRNANDTGADLASIPIVVERNGSVSNVTTGHVSYPTGGTPVSFSADFRNTNVVADYPALTLEFSIRDSGGANYMTSGGAFAADGTGLLDTYTQGVASLANGTTTSGAASIASPIFPSRGVYILHARWKLNIGSVIPSDTTYTFLVGPTVDSYSNSGRTVAAEDFNINAGAQVYLKGDIYVASTNVKYAIYDPAGNLVTTTTAGADGLGVITPSFDTTGQTRTGTWHVGIYPASAAIPATYSTTDFGRYASDSFRLTYQLQGLSGSTATTNQIGLTWTGVSAPELANGGGYKVYRSTDGGSTFGVLASGLSSASYTDTGLVNCTTYVYKVTYINAEGFEQPQSSTITKQPTSGLNPANIGNTNQGVKTGTADFSWTAVSLDTGGNSVLMDHYRISSGIIGDFSTETLAATTASPSWSDTTRSLTDGFSYWYKIVAVDACGQTGS